jgi:L-idonate 5-dehydrogenase
MTSAVRAVVVHAPHDLRVERFAFDPAGPGEVEVRIERGGICGSDLHYYHDGGFGTVRIRAPMVLGHEIAGTVTAVGAGVTRVKPGTRVAVDPSRPCGSCTFCRRGLQAHCTDMRFYGSAMRFPHVDGGFRERLVCTEAQAVPMREGVSAEIAAFAEPLAVCLHAAARAGSLAGKRVLVTGCGPIGALAVIVARHLGAREIVATDVAPRALGIARAIGADEAVDVAADPGALDRFKENKGRFDIAFECSGHRSGVADAVAAVRPRGTLVQVGLGGLDMPFPINAVVAREIDYKGTFRFFEEFEQAADLLGSGRIDVSPLLSAVVPAERAKEAFELASDKSKAMKVQLAF